VLPLTDKFVGVPEQIVVGELTVKSFGAVIIISRLAVIKKKSEIESV
jgi:hypothetical protein